jgi:hypothetical protein
MLQQHARPGASPQIAAGFHVSSLTRDEREYYTDRLQGIAALLGQHKPWLIKDPRLSWFASLWLEQLEAPLCVLLVDMQPQHLAQHLALQQQQRQQRHRGVGGSSDGQEVVSAATHLERWTNSTLSSIKVREREQQAGATWASHAATGSLNDIVAVGSLLFECSYFKRVTM